MVVGAAFGVLGVALMFYPELGGLRFDSGVLGGLALSLGGTLCFCLGNMLSLAAQRKGLPIFATIGWGMVYGVVVMALVALLRGERSGEEENGDKKDTAHAICDSPTGGSASSERLTMAPRSP